VSLNQPVDHIGSWLAVLIEKYHVFEPNQRQTVNADILGGCNTTVGCKQGQLNIPTCLKRGQLIGYAIA